MLLRLTVFIVFVETATELHCASTYVPQQLTKTEKMSFAAYDLMPFSSSCLKMGNWLCHTCQRESRVYNKSTSVEVWCKTKPRAVNIDHDNNTIRLVDAILMRCAQNVRPGKHSHNHKSNDQFAPAVNSVQRSPLATLSSTSTPAWLMQSQQLTATCFMLLITTYCKRKPKPRCSHRRPRRSCQIIHLTGVKTIHLNHMITKKNNSMTRKRIV